MKKSNQIDQTITISSTEMKLFDSDKPVLSDFSNDSSKKYTISDKKIIASRIEQIKNKKIYLKLFKIITDDNNEYTTNTNGVFLNMNNLHDKTLTKIIHILDVYDDLKKKKISNNKWTLLLQTQYNSQSTQLLDDKYTNHEKMFFKRHQTNNSENDDITFWGANHNKQPTSNSNTDISNENIQKN
jgi:hypothetical protein